MQKKNEIETIAESLKKGGNEKDLCQEAKAAILELFSNVDQYKSDKTFKEILQDMAILSNKYKAIESSEKHLPPVVDINAPNKNIKQQRLFPSKKKTTQ